MKQAVVTKARPGSIAEGIADRLDASGFAVSTLPLDTDVRDTGQVDEQIRLAADGRGPLTVGVYAAGKSFTSHPFEWSHDAAAAINDVNLTAAEAFTSSFARCTVGNGESKTIVLIGSLWSRKHGTNNAVYCASKAGLAHFVTCIATDLNKAAPGQFTVVGVHPGNVAGTPMSRRVADSLRNRMTPSQIEELYDNAITPDGVAEAVESIIGKHWLSGENIYLSGGEKR